MSTSLFCFMLEVEMEVIQTLLVDKTDFSDMDELKFTCRNTVVRALGPHKGGQQSRHGRAR